MGRDSLLPRILLINSNPVESAWIITALSQKLPGWEIKEILNVEDLAQAIANANFDLVITDDNLSWATGIEVLQTIKEHHQACPVIMFTDSHDIATVVAAMKAGLDDYILKSPHQIDKLVQAIEQAIQKTSLSVDDSQATATALQESQQQYQTLVENSPDIIERFDTQLRHLYVSPSLTNISGIPAPVFLGKTCRELGMSPVMVNTWESAAKTLLQTGKKQIIEFEVETLNGIRDFEMAIAPELSYDNTIESILCISRDVTDRKAAEKALKSQAQQAQALNRVVQIIRSSLDLQTIFSTATAEVTQLLAVNRTSIIQYLPEQQIWKVLAVHRLDESIPDSIGLEIPDQGNLYAAQLKQQQVVRINGVDEINDPIHKQLAQKFTQVWLLTPIIVNGTIWGSLSLTKPESESPWKDEEVELSRKVADQLAIAVQQAQLYQQVQQELRERQQAEAALQKLNQELEQRVAERTQQLQQAEARFEQIFHASPYPIVIMSLLDQRFIEANEAFCQLFGYSREQLITQTPEDFTFFADPAYEGIIRQQILAKGSVRDLECAIRTRTGEIRTFLTSAECIHVDGIPCFLTTGNDITERKQAEATRQQQARKERLLRLITQEIRQFLDLDAILTTAVTEVRHTLSVDRAAVYRFHPDWSGSFIVESVSKGWKKLVSPDFQEVWEDSYLQQTQGGRYKNHETFAVSDIYTVGHQDCHIALLEQFQARAYAIAPIICGDSLWGLLAIYQNTAPRNWETWEIELLEQIGNQLAIAIQQSELYGQLQTELQERKEIEEKIRTSLKEKEVLLREVYHRVKNNMQMVSSLLSLQTNSIKDPAVLKLLTESQRRVKTMALIHERLYRSKNLSRINFAFYVPELVGNLVQSYTTVDSEIEVTLEVADLELDLDTAVPCGLIINELVSNALKYAFPQQKGEITLQFWLEDETDYYCLVVKDDGVGIPADFGSQCTTSLGMQLVYGLTEQIGGEIQLNRQRGSEFKIRFQKRS
ncbi:GAF domain-containing protein [Nostoc sp. CENA543]|uniref:GAF domain-containing protein n=1 Tax=Nostoc sp. CENA543 TaxID=1869241 RepID=UPI001863D970|nr:GAF domain-containing protein [Nostoc sp. CENA543]